MKRLRSTRQPRTVALPIHPLVTLEDWVCALHFAMADGDLTPAQRARAMDEILRDPAAARLFDQACRDEAMLRVVFASAPAPASHGAGCREVA